MRKQKINKKRTFSISLDQELLKIINEKYSNRSKFVVYCMIEELCKNDDIKKELRDKKIIL